MAVDHIPSLTPFSMGKTIRWSFWAALQCWGCGAGTVPYLCCSSSHIPGSASPAVSHAKTQQYCGRGRGNYIPWVLEGLGWWGRPTVHRTTCKGASCVLHPTLHLLTLPLSSAAKDVLAGDGPGIFSWAICHVHHLRTFAPLTSHELRWIIA